MTHPDWNEDSWEGKLLIDEDTNDKEKSLTWENISSPKQDEALRKLAKLKIQYKGKLEPVLDLVTIAETSKPPKYKGTVYQRTLVGSSPPSYKGVLLMEESKPMVIAHLPPGSKEFTHTVTDNERSKNSKTLEGVISRLKNINKQKEDEEKERILEEEKRKEAKRLHQREIEKRYRERKRKILVDAEEERKCLEKRNRDLRVQVTAMKETIKQLKRTIIAANMETLNDSGRLVAALDLEVPGIKDETRMEITKRGPVIMANPSCSNPNGLLRPPQ